jgi:hypothetical protein
MKRLVSVIGRLAPDKLISVTVPVDSPPLEQGRLVYLPGIARVKPLSATRSYSARQLYALNRLASLEIRLSAN